MNKDTLKILVTGAAGFIGAALCKKLIFKRIKVIGIDNLNSYYDIKLKKSRLIDITESSFFDADLWSFHEGDLRDNELLETIFKENTPNVVVNLAAQAGVRYSLENPSSYIQTNLVGFSNVIEICRRFNVENFVYASSSSVYGSNTELPYDERQNVDHPLSLYAATKRSNELIAHSYSNLYNIPATGLRFFTVYGPWGRPDMAPMLFAKAILKREEIFVYNSGKMSRDFTYIDDIVEVIYRCCLKPATPDKGFRKGFPNPSTSFSPHRIFNVGNNSSINLMEFIDILEIEFGIKAKKIFKPMQPGDVLDTYANVEDIKSWVNFTPKTSLRFGIKKFAKWFLDFHANEYENLLKKF